MRDLQRYVITYLQEMPIDLKTNVDGELPIGWFKNVRLRRVLCIGGLNRYCRPTICD
jgi:hypothetical protein